MHFFEPPYAPGAGQAREWRPPTQGEQCILFSPSRAPAAGIVLGAVDVC
ncbi:phage baseplate assembly protein V [Chromobacterium violaceum]|nr:phage baseplate assembly protein V [Chromobacterium violaceum]MBX9267781.1 phage baseplate assembly protein V [Chromobacterium violaceum]QRO34994.1 phage baseplate assembly protein V [Chromobacterium violaceum]QRQ15201.1 phage baseplate assembly protein V [Chromobacterium violaceum]